MGGMTHSILIFGATGGIGAALTRQLEADGRALHLSARDPSRLAVLADDVGAARSHGNVRNPADIDRVVAAATAGGGLAGLVFAVGSIDLAPLKRLSAAQFADAFALNV